MSTPLRILVVTDSFPPVCGGSGWSTWELVRGLMGRGHHVDVIKLEAGADPGVRQDQYESVPVTIVRRPSPDVPVVRNVMKNERLWSASAEYLYRAIASQPVDVVHAQHVMSTVPSIRAGARAGVPVVATVRDYWPVCYWSDLIYDPSQPTLCPACTARNMTRCVRPRAGAASLAAWPLIPYMRANLRTKRRTLATASAVIAVSTVIADDLRARAPELASTPLYTIPNPVDMTALDRAHDTATVPLAEPYLLYVGKIATNKGTQFLVPALRAAATGLPLVVVGDGPRRADLEADARAGGVDIRVIGWRGRDEVWAWMRHARALVFPSYGPESLSRVLIEASALGTPIAAMDTGGTRDIVESGVSGLLSRDADGLARDLARLVSDDRLRAALGHGARAHAHARFAAPSVVERVEQVYRSLLIPDAA